MIPLKFKCSRNINLESKDIHLNDLVIEGLTSFGFLEIDRNLNNVKFKHDFKDPDIESFQRRYGNGEIIIDNDTSTLSISRDYSKSFIFSILLFFGFSTVMIMMKLNQTNIDLSAISIILLTAALAASAILEYTISRSLILNKQKKLLEMLDNFITNKIKSPYNNGVHP